MAVGLVISTVIPWGAIALLKKHFEFDGMLPLSVFTVPPAVGVLSFMLLLFGRLGIVLTLIYYYFGVAFFGAGWAALLGVLGWMLGLKIQARANLRPPALFTLGGGLGLIVGTILLPTYCYLLGIPSSFESLWILAGAVSGTVAGIIVTSYVFDSCSNRPPTAFIDPWSRW